MRRLHMLLWTEWRDARAVTRVSVGLYLCVMLLLIGLHSGAADATQNIGRFLLPYSSGLYASLLAAEAFATDINTGRLKTRALLPVSLTLSWFAKLLHVFVAGVAFYGFALIATSLALTLSDPDSMGAFWSGVSQGSGQAPPVALLVATTLLCSIVFARGFPAVAVAGLFVAPLLALHLGTEWRFEYGLEQHRSARELGAVLVFGSMALVMVMGSLGGVLYGRLPGGLATRRVTAAALFPLLISASSASYAASRLSDWITVDPDDPRTLIESVSVSPSGRYLALSVGRQNDWWESVHSRVWVADIETGRVVQAPERHVVLEGWHGDRLLAGRRRVEHRVDPIEIDVQTGEVSATELLPARHRALHTPELPARWYAYLDEREVFRVESDGMLSRRRSADHVGELLTWQITVRSCASGETPLRPSGEILAPKLATMRIVQPAEWGGEFSNRPSVRATARPGRVAYWTDRALVLHDLPTGHMTELLGELGVDERSDMDLWAAFSSDNRLLVAGSAGALRVFDSTTARQVRGPYASARFIAGQVLHFADENGAFLEDLSVTASRPIAIAPRSYGEDFVDWLPDGRLVVVRPGHRAVDLVESDERVVRRIVDFDAEIPQ